MWLGWRKAGLMVFLLGWSSADIKMCYCFPCSSLVPSFAFELLLIQEFAFVLINCSVSFCSRDSWDWRKEVHERCYIPMACIWRSGAVLLKVKSFDCFLNTFFYFWIFFFKDFIYFLERRGERKRETSMCGCLSCTSYWGPGLQPRHMPWLGIEPATLWFAGLHSIHWATTARATSEHFCSSQGFLCEGSSSFIDAVAQAPYSVLQQHFATGLHYLIGAAVALRQPLLLLPCCWMSFCSK